MRMKQSNIGPIGLDIGAARIKAVQLQTGSGGTPSLTASLVLDRCERGGVLGAKDAWRLAEALRRRGFRGRQVVLAAPKAATRAGVMRLPTNVSREALQRMAAVELARTHKVEPNTLEVACWPVPAAGHRAPVAPGDATGSMLAVGCDSTAADTLIDTLEDQGLLVAGLDVESWAIARSCARLIGGEPGIVAAVDLGYEAATFVFIKEGDVVYERTLSSCGTRSLLSAVEAEHDLPEPAIDYALFTLGFEARQRGEPGDDRVFEGVRPQLDGHYATVARELKLSMQYAVHQYPDEHVGRLLVTGGGAVVPGAIDRVGVELEAPTHAVRMSEVAACPAGFEPDADSSALTVAAGLALYPREAIR